MHVTGLIFVCKWTIKIVNGNNAAWEKWHSQFISRGANYSWWLLMLGDFKGAQTWKNSHQSREERNQPEMFSPTLVCWCPQNVLRTSHGWREALESLLWNLASARSKGRTSPLSTGPEQCMWPWAQCLSWLGFGFPFRVEVSSKSSRI